MVLNTCYHIQTTTPVGAPHFSQTRRAVIIGIPNQPSTQAIKLSNIEYAPMINTSAFTAEIAFFIIFYIIGGIMLIVIIAICIFCKEEYDNCPWCIRIDIKC